MLIYCPVFIVTSSHDYCLRLVQYLFESQISGTEIIIRFPAKPVLQSPRTQQPTKSPQSGAQTGYWGHLIIIPPSPVWQLRVIWIISLPSELNWIKFCWNSLELLHFHSSVPQLSSQEESLEINWLVISLPLCTDGWNGWKCNQKSTFSSQFAASG